MKLKLLQHTSLMVIALAVFALPNACSRQKKSVESKSKNSKPTIDMEEASSFIELAGNGIDDPLLRLPFIISHTMIAMEISVGDPPTSEEEITLVRVEEDGTATIHVGSTDEEISAKPSEPFRGKYKDIGFGMIVRTFGENGLVLNYSDFKSQTILVSRHGVEYSHGKKSSKNSDKP